MKELQHFKNGNIDLPIKVNPDNSIEFDAEQAAIGLGLTKIVKGNLYVRWERVNEYLKLSTSGQQLKRGDFITEPQFYKLAIKANNSTAEKFQDWVTSEVLPAIRKHGAYMTSETIEDLLTNPDNIIKLATQLKTEREGRLIAEQKVNELQPKATYYDLILRNKTLLSITKIAKDYGWSGSKMNKELHRLGVQYKQGKTWLLYQKYAKQGYTQSQTFVDDEDTSHMNTYWTQAGRLFIYETLKDQDVLPLIELDQAG